jgi:hypothetical protein
MMKTNTPLVQVSHWQPFSGSPLREFQEEKKRGEMNRVFGPFGAEYGPPVADSYPPVNIWRYSEGVYAEAELPEEKQMSNQSKVVAFDVDKASLISLCKALPDSVIKVVNGATAASLTRDWNPGTVDLIVVNARKEVAETLELCKFLVSCGVFARDTPMVTDSQDEMPKTLGLHRDRQNMGRPHSPLLVLVSPSRKNIVTDVLKAGAHSCLMLPINAKDVASMLVHAQAGNQPGRHTLDLERAQTEDTWQDEGGEG